MTTKMLLPSQESHFRKHHKGPPQKKKKGLESPRPKNKKIQASENSTWGSSHSVSPRGISSASNIQASNYTEHPAIGCSHFTLVDRHTCHTKTPPNLSARLGKYLPTCKMQISHSPSFLRRHRKFLLPQAVHTALVTLPEDCLYARVCPSRDQLLQPLEECFRHKADTAGSLWWQGNELLPSPRNVPVCSVMKMLKNNLRPDFFKKEERNVASTPSQVLWKKWPPSDDSMESGLLWESNKTQSLFNRSHSVLLYVRHEQLQGIECQHVYTRPWTNGPNMLHKISATMTSWGSSVDPNTMGSLSYNGSDSTRWYNSFGGKFGNI